MGRAGVASASVIAGLLLLTGCWAVPPLSGPERSEVVHVSGGSCRINWWLGPAVDDPPAEASRIAEGALEDASVSDSQWAGWYQLLDDDPDRGPESEVRLRGRAYLEAVREDVRSALEDAGYPDIERVVEVYSNLSCR